MQGRMVIFLSVLALSLALVFIPTVMEPLRAAASSSGVVNETVGNQQMQLHVLSVKEDNVEGPTKVVNVEVVLKNLEPNPRTFNIFFARIIDSSGHETRASPLLSTIIPVRIPSNDILKGTIGLVLPDNRTIRELVWGENDGEKLVIDLNRSKQPADPVPESSWSLSYNKGRVVSDDRVELTVHHDLLERSGSSNYYLIDITLRNNGDEVETFSTVFFFVKDQEGYLYPADIEDFHLMKNPLKKGKLNPGQEVRGEILFLLRDTANNVMFIYDAGLGRGTYFAIPEFSLYILVFVISIVMVLTLTRYRSRRVSRWKTITSADSSVCIRLSPYFVKG